LQVGAVSQSKLYHWTATNKKDKQTIKTMKAKRRGEEQKLKTATADESIHWGQSSSGEHRTRGDETHKDVRSDGPLDAVHQRRHCFKLAHQHSRPITLIYATGSPRIAESANKNNTIDWR